MWEGTPKYLPEFAIIFHCPQNTSTPWCLYISVPPVPVRRATYYKAFGKSLNLFVTQLSFWGWEATQGDPEIPGKCTSLWFSDSTSHWFFFCNKEYISMLCWKLSHSGMAIIRWGRSIMLSPEVRWDRGVWWGTQGGVGWGSAIRVGMAHPRPTDKTRQIPEAWRTASCNWKSDSSQKGCLSFFWHELQGSDSDGWWGCGVSQHWLRFWWEWQRGCQRER